MKYPGRITPKADSRYFGRSGMKSLLRIIGIIPTKARVNNFASEKTNSLFFQIHH
jgi:hypothetical protein